MIDITYFDISEALSKALQLRDQEILESLEKIPKDFWIKFAEALSNRGEQSYD